MSTDRIESTVRILRTRWANKDPTPEDVAAGLRRAADRVDQACPRDAALARRWREEAWVLAEQADAAWNKRCCHQVQGMLIDRGTARIRVKIGRSGMRYH